MSFVSHAIKYLSLPNRTLGLSSLLLLQLLHINILPHPHGRQQNRHKHRTGNNHTSLHITIRGNNGISNRIAHGIIRLDDQRAVNLRGEILAALGEVTLQLREEHVGPDATGDGETDRCTDGAEHIEEGEGDGDFLVGDGGHDGDLAAGGEDACADSVEDLTHDEEADVGIGGSEGDEKGGAENDEGDTGVGNVFEVAEAADEVADEGGDEGGCEGEGV